jgi:hypothetical protein
MLINQGARVEGSQMLHEASAAARRMGARGAILARRADDLLAGIGPLETSRPAVSPAPRREAVAQREPRVEPGTDMTDAEPPPAESASESSGDAVFRETTLPPL